MLTKAQYQFIFDSIVEDIVSYMVDDDGMTMVEAFDRVYNSATYEKMLDRKNGLYLYSPVYIYDRIMEERGEGEKQK